MDYQRHYELLMSRARSRELTGYIEHHHVIPRCVNGSDDKSNIVALTAEEHLVAHELLIKIYPGVRGLVFAALIMCNGTPDNPGRRNNKTYAWIRRLAAHNNSFWRRSGLNVEVLTTWATADVIFDYLHRHPKHGAYRIKRALSLKTYPSGPVARIRGGWNPRLDEEWLIFSADYEVARNIAIDERARDDAPPYLSPVLTSRQIDLWTSASVIYEYHRLYPKDGAKKAFRCLGFGPLNTCITVLNRIKAGWNPVEDEEWLKFHQANALPPFLTKKEDWADLRDTKTGARNHRFGLKSWLHPHVKGHAMKPWLLADRIYEAYVQDRQLGYVLMARKFGFKLNTVLRKIKAGWNPLNDQDWIEWKGAQNDPK